jgi:PKHD-type hydroxylase|tara:strand:+ start:1726 stop:2316 length:591 start_codon:yes stop_codon:yes gene_type:complete
MIFENKYWVFKNLLPINFCDDVIAYGNSLKQKQAEVFGNLKGEDLNKIRQSNVVWMEDCWIFRHLKPFIEIANKNAGWNFQIDGTEQMQFTKYKLNGHYDWHVDTGSVPYNDVTNQKTFGKIRKISLTCSLADGLNYKGGTFQLKGPENDQIIEVDELRKKGSVVLFPSYLRHRVAPVTSGERYSLVCWVLGRPFV